MNLKKILTIAISVLLLSLPALALAQNEPTDMPDLNQQAQEATDSLQATTPELEKATQDLEKATEAAAKGGGLFATGMLGALAGFAIVGVILGLAWLVLWIWSLIDVIGRTFKGSEKTIWIILLIASLVLPFIPVVNFLGIVTWLVPIIYLIVGRKRGTKSGGKAPGASAAPTAPSAVK